MQLEPRQEHIHPGRISPRLWTLAFIFFVSSLVQETIERWKFTLRAKFWTDLN